LLEKLKFDDDFALPDRLVQDYITDGSVMPTFKRSLLFSDEDMHSLIETFRTARKKEKTPETKHEPKNAKGQRNKKDLNKKNTNYIMFSLLLVSVCYLFGGALGLFLSGYTTKYLSPKEIEDEMKEELLMIAQMDRLCFESLYDDEVSNMPSVALDDDTKRQLKDSVLDYEVPGNIIKMYYDYEKKDFVIIQNAVK